MTKKLNKWQEELLKLSTKEESYVAKELQKAYEKILKETRRELRYWLDNFEYENLPEYRKMQLANLMTMDNEIVAVLRDSSTEIESIIERYKAETMQQGYYSTFYQIEAQERVAVNFVGLNTSVIRNAVSEPIAGMSLSQRLREYHMVLADKASDAITNGLIMGDSYADIARKVAEEAYLTQRKAMTIVRTEGGRLRSLGRMESRREAVEMGMQLKKRWVSTLDTRTRSTHQSLDGQVVEEHEKFKSSSGNEAMEPRLFGVEEEDVNCRCDSVSDIEGVPPSYRRDNIDGNVIEYATYEDWFEKRVNDTLGGMSFEG